MKHFSFEGKYYDQTDGVAMGSPLAPGLANFFMSHYEKEWLSNFDEVSSSYYTGNVDGFFFWSSIHTMGQNGFSLILIQETLMLNLLWKRRSTQSYSLSGCFC